MAFNRPIDADRVDDLGLLSSILRVPIIGPIFWVIGKITRQQHDDELDSAVCRTVPRESFATTIDESHSSLNSPSSESLPCMIEQIGILSDDPQRNMGPINLDKIKHDRPPPLKKTRKTSWSDESGHMLAKYCEEVRKLQVIDVPWIVFPY